MTRCRTRRATPSESRSSSPSDLGLQNFGSVRVSSSQIHFCAGAHAIDPVLTVSECAYTHQQPIVRRQILSVTSYGGRPAKSAARSYDTRMRSYGGHLSGPSAGLSGICAFSGARSALINIQNVSSCSRTQYTE